MTRTHSTGGESPAADRRAFLRLGAAAAAAAAGGAAFTGEAAAQVGGTAVPNLYPGWNAKQFRGLQDHENAHVAFLVNALGAAARPKPNFKNLTMPDLRTFAAGTFALENTGVGAYLGAAPILFSRANLAAAGSIALIEARHAGYINTLLNGVHTFNVFSIEQDFEGALTIDQVLALAGPFIQDLNGGPPMSFNATPSATNDVAILNFALGLEYLEAEFYNINVPRFFPT